MRAGTHLLGGWLTATMAVTGGWLYEREPLSWFGLAAGEAAGLLAWTYAAVAVLYCLPACAAALVPSPWRVWWRRGRPRPAIPVRLRRAVYAADRHRCLYCGSKANLQLDHVKPWSCGGLTSLWNLVTLCRDCNLAKSNYWRFRSGHVIYRPWAGYDREDLAVFILAAERHVRWLPGRCVRAAWALR